ncbi:glycine rich domain-containing protein [Paenibacillus sp. L3-i20]|uniref:glycine rich domain-containing protein n=1 Tax=Paenibacillus sp. L3-i20 TaxID=2905833 RepID=UPI00208ACB6F|nr:glycine rich domain-containing protein [Paenibacillus sp. L3-i20]GKU77609.1 hypothetical protein L3i20_v220060 [Paenibacillus sp. L3-i20]
MKKYVAIFLIFVILLSIFSQGPTNTVQAVVLGGSGSIPSGGTPGPNGGVNLNAVYRVGIAKETLSTENKLGINMSREKIEGKLQNHFGNHFPKMDSSILFAPKANYTQNAVIGWYSSSAGEMNFGEKPPAYMAAKLREIGSPERNDSNFFSKLKKYAPYSKDGENIKKLANGKWKNVIDWSGGCADGCAKYASHIWNWILSDHKLIEQRIKQFTFDKYADGDGIDGYEARLHYLDLLMTLYVLVPKEDEAFYESEINRFISKTKIDTNPVLIAIDTVSRYSVPKYSSKYLFMPSIDFVLWAHGATPKGDIRESSFDATGVSSNTKDLIKKSADLSKKEMPSRDRITDKSAKGNGFAYGYNGVTGYMFKTSSGQGVWSGRGSVDFGIMEALKFNSSGSYYGFMIAGGHHNRLDPEEVDCKCSQKVSLKMDEKAAPSSDEVKTDKIGKKINMPIDIKQTDEVIKLWEQFIAAESGRTAFKMKVTLHRNYREGGDGTPAKWSKEGKIPDPAKEVSVTPVQLLKYVKGQSQLMYTDDLMNYDMPEGSKVTFAYNASITVSWTEDGKLETLTCESLLKESPEITFWRAEPPPPIKETGSYTSVPEFWSEIKEGSPSTTGTGSNETFEAMAGTPTTRSLYFASGGSEFIVDVEVEYVPEAESTRTYRAFYSGGVPSEFKIGDQAKNYTVPSPSGASSESLTVNGHQGGTVTATWTGTLPYTGSVTWGDHWTNVNNKWDYGDYNTAKSQASAWAGAVNSFKITHTAASDSKERSFINWGASITNDRKVEPAGWANAGSAAVPCSGTPCVGGRPKVPSSGQNGSPGTYTITVEGKLPAKIIDGPSSTYDLPMVEDKWKQKITYDYTKITKANVWKLDKSKVNGMTMLTGTEDLTASIVQGDPTVFFNIAEEGKLPTKASEEGRLRYSIEPNQHDEVVWNLGRRTNKDDGNGDNGLISGPGQTADWAKGIIYNNYKEYSEIPDYHILNSTEDDKKTVEFNKFKELRTEPVEVTAISDFLVLQTSSGDQSVMYFEKTSSPVEPQRQVDIPKTSFNVQWTSNKNSAADWLPDKINIGSYNGNYQNPNTKYSGYDNSKLETIFDKYPAGINKPARPSSSLRLMETNVNPIVTNPNGLYVTGTSSVFYKLLIKEGKGLTPYSTAVDGDYGEAGVSFMSNYSDSHSKVNDIVLHNPVSVEKSIVKALSAERDQRTTESKAIGGNLQPPTIEYEKILKPDYRQNILSNGDAEFLNTKGSVAGWQTWTAAPPSDVTFTSSRIGDDDEWVMNGKSSFEIYTTPNKNIDAVYYKDVTVKPNTNYKFTGDISCHRCEGYFYIDIYGADTNKAASTVRSTTAVNTGAKHNKELTFTTPADVSKVRVHIVKGKSSGGQNVTEHVFADNLSLQNMSLQEFIPVDPIYGYELVKNPDYSTAPEVLDFKFTGSAEEFVAPRSGSYKFEVWGAEGGTSGFGGKGGYSVGSMNLNKGDKLSLHVGGQTGWNGGGSGHGRITDSGGGATDIRKGGTGLNNRIIVAGGGGGWGSRSGINGGVGGGSSGGRGKDGADNRKGAEGGTQTSGGSGGYGLTTGGAGVLGVGGSNNAGSGSGAGGGGGGYYGGGAGGSDYSSYDDLDDGGGGGGSGYVEGLTGGSTIAGDQSIPNPSGGNQTGHSGNGFIRIHSPIGANVPEYIEVETMLDSGSSVPPEDAYITKKIETSPTAPVNVPGLGKFEPGNFINLDYGFQIFFPNNGNFFGDGAWGIPNVTANRGKGFVDNMDTTEWTQSKAVKFDFNVIYDGQTHAAGEWIDLPVICNDFSCMYDFYLPLGNREAISALVEFQAIAINGDTLEPGAKPTNKVRDEALQALHSALKSFNIDIVGRIGNLVIEDTGDFRFSNLFKQPMYPTKWLVQNLVKKVDPNKQNAIVGDIVDIRGEKIQDVRNYLNTYGLLTHLNREPIPLPLSPEKNNIAALRKQPMRLGYKVFSDVQTIGNYYGSMQIIPRYYALNLKTGDIKEVDVYMNVGGSYKPINKSSRGETGYKPESIHKFNYTLDWDAEHGRRNYDVFEANVTNTVMEYANTNDPGDEKSLEQPFGDRFPFGSADIMNLTGRNRTFIGSTRTNGDDKNPGGAIPTELFNMQAQRWHFTYGLPSSAVVVEKNEKPTQDNIDTYRNNKTVILMAADINAYGDTYALKYGSPSQNTTVEIAGTSWPIEKIPYPVLNVYSAHKSAADDLEISGTH